MANSVGVESRFILLLVVLASFCLLFLAFVLGRFVVFGILCARVCVLQVFISLGPQSGLVSSD